MTEPSIMLCDLEEARRMVAKQLNRE